MNYNKGEKPLYTINRFQWLDNERFRIVARDGIEKIVNFKNNFSEEAFNVIPQFKHSKDEYKEIYNFFSFRKMVDINSTEELLRRKYQEYKSLYYLFNKRDEQTMYE